MTDGERDALVEAVATLERIQRLVEGSTWETVHDAKMIAGIIRHDLKETLPQLRAAAPLAFHVGQSVRIRYATGSVLSGRTGTIMKGYMDGTFCVKVDGAIMDWHLSAHELERLPALSAEAPLAVGMRVKVKHTGSLFYGATGVIVSELDGEPHGWHVEFEGGSASYIDADLERLDTPVREPDAAKAALSALLDDMREVEWNTLSLDLTRQITAVLGMENDKTRRWLEMLARETEDGTNG